MVSRHTSAVGAKEVSPARKRWERRRNKDKPRRGGTALSHLRDNGSVWQASLKSTVRFSAGGAGSMQFQEMLKEQIGGNFRN